MHEISLVQGLLKQLALLAAEHGSKSVSKVRLEVGPHSGIVIDSFKFGFEVLAAEIDLTRHARLEIVIPPLRYKCCYCGHVRQTERLPETCSQCAKTLLVPDGGDGLILLQVEME
ncbi:MAG: hydrogenase maturation nickel metallochaperone HypA [Deltaproteobacteria bacterium]|nr:hydrogenase maturation nickel metallochaperone HypA [Deltaproteobacteria bacterium]